MFEIYIKDKRPMNYQDIADQILAIENDEEKKAKQIRDNRNNAIRPYRIECGKLGHIFAKPWFPITDDGRLCLVCGEWEKLKP